MDFPDPVGPPQPPVLAEPLADVMTADGAMPATPVATSHSALEIVSLDDMRSAMVANFEQDDLDVPAFLRKRGEVM